MATFVGHAGAAIRKLRRLCVGCEVELTNAVAADGGSGSGSGGGGEVSLLAEDETKLAAALGLVQRWIRQQQVGWCIPGASDSVLESGGIKVYLAADWIAGGSSVGPVGEERRGFAFG